MPLKSIGIWSKALGTDGTIGFIISWNGNKNAGEGEKEIINIINGKRIETQIRFVRPMKITADVIMETESLSDNETKVNLINSGGLKYPMNIFIPLAEKNFPKDMDASLLALKEIFEKEIIVEQKIQFKHSTDNNKPCQG